MALTDALSDLPDAFYRRDGDAFVATDATRGPWSSAHQHAGPPAALISRCIARALPEMRVARLTFDLAKPIPIGRLRVDVEEVRTGRKAALRFARLVCEGKEIATATALLLRTESVVDEADLRAGDSPGVTAWSPAPPADCEPYVFGFFRDRVGYHVAMELRVARGVFGSGAMSVWMRARVPLVEGEALSPLDRVVLASDSGNGVSVYLDLAEYTFANADLSVHLHALPAGEWVCLDATTITGRDGIGMAESLLFDERGAIGRAVQTLLLERREPRGG